VEEFAAANPANPAASCFPWSPSALTCFALVSASLPEALEALRHAVVAPERVEIEGRHGGGTSSRLRT
jgi:hypothetical protein